MRKKREKAEEITTVEDRMLTEKTKADAKNQEAAVEAESSSSDDEEDGKPSAPANGEVERKMSAVPPTHHGPVNNRIRTWFRTGGGDENDVGATQKRRNEACGFLMGGQTGDRR